MLAIVCDEWPTGDQRAVAGPPRGGGRVEHERMFASGGKVREQAAVLALVAQARGEWYLVAQLVEANGSALRVGRHDWTGFEPPELLGSASRLQPAAISLRPWRTPLRGRPGARRRRHATRV